MSSDPTRQIRKLTIDHSVKLNEIENPWKPSVLDRTPKTETEKLVSKFRSILNKLTEQKFEILVARVHELHLKSDDLLDTTIKMAIEKAVNEPTFCELYAKFIKRIWFDENKVKVNSLCLREFENQNEAKYLDERERLHRDIANARNEGKEELKNQLEDQYLLMKRRYVGFNRLNGHLADPNSLFSSVQELLRRSTEEALESFCVVLSFAGRDLEREKDLGELFGRVAQLVEGRKTTLRIRFMLENLISQRENNWEARKSHSF
ncbi:eukaryotic translation initiation factor 4 gamma 1-like [Cloeon dipterum]|uniref:eukaryotic translation initiation factor 4 gamma 1-like n=1 Tax=Cloeon dipterum TaxID=197152 RepID=UPI00322074A0